MGEVKKCVFFVTLYEECDEDELYHAIFSAVSSCRGATVNGYTTEYDLIDYEEGVQ